MVILSRVWYDIIGKRYKEYEVHLEQSDGLFLMLFGEEGLCRRNL